MYNEQIMYLLYVYMKLNMKYMGYKCIYDKWYVWYMLCDKSNMFRKIWIKSPDIMMKWAFRIRRWTAEQCIYEKM